MAGKVTPVEEDPPPRWTTFDGIDWSKRPDPETDTLPFAQFFSFLHSYDKHALFIRNRAFFDEPRSLQCDIVCRVFFVPFCVFLFCCQGYYWFMMNGVVVDTPKK